MGATRAGLSNVPLLSCLSSDRSQQYDDSAQRANRSIPAPLPRTLFFHLAV